jgi:hypothetical protein
MKEDMYMDKLLSGDRDVEPWEAELVHLLPMDRPWAKSEVLAVLPRLKEYCREDMIERRQLAAVRPPPVGPRGVRC